jgi:signal transduction histidine kinase
MHRRVEDELRPAGPTGGPQVGTDARPRARRRGPGLARGLALALAAAAAGGLVWLLWWLRAPGLPGGASAAAAGLAAVALLLAAGAAGLVGHLLARRRLEAALHEARSHARTLGDVIDTWQWQTDAAHRLVRWQPPQGAPASSWADGAAARPMWECFDDAQGTLRARLQSQAPLAELRVRPADGRAEAQAAHWSLRGMPSIDALGRFAGYVGIARPLAEEPAPQADAQKEGADRMAAEHASFSYTVSHDLRAPLRVVEGFTRIVQEDYGRLLDRVGNDHLERVLAAAARMQHMIDAMLALAQLSAQPLAQQPVDLSQLAAFVVDELARQAPDRKVEVRIEPGLTARGDPTLLRIVLENLLGNAWKYSAKTPQARVGFESRQQDGRRVYVVHDNGAGFDMRFADRLFGVFQRLHSVNDYQGTGVGLASVRRIVRRHGGDVWAEGEVGRGASFYFTLG